MRLDADGIPGDAVGGDTAVASRAAPAVAIDWPSVREAYVAGVEPVAAIRRRFGLTEAQLRWWRLRGGWVRRTPVSDGPLALSPEQAFRFAETANARLAQLIVAEVTRLEDRVCRDGALAADDLPVLIGLAKALELVMKIRTSGGMQRRRGGSPGSEAKGHGHHAGHEGRDAGGDFDADAARAELKGRLDRLRRRAGAGRGDRGGDA